MRKLYCCNWIVSIVFDKWKEKKRKVSFISDIFRWKLITCSIKYYIDISNFEVYCHHYSVMTLPNSFFTLPHINADLLPSFFPVHFQVRQKPPAGRSSRQQPAGSSSGAAGGGGGGGGGSSGASSNSSSARASPAGTMRAPSGQHGRPPLASNFSLDDITAQMEKVKYLIV